MQTPTNSTAERLLKKAQEVAERQALSKEEFTQLKKACRAIFSTRNGIVVAKAMAKLSGIYAFPKNNTNPIAMGEQNGKAFMYCFFVKSLLSAETITQIETQEAPNA